ncbi:MAG TPA: hypothetical protein VNY05_45980 [Candidatus Acidoferrales bacterium]|nr:hypothetical protein [Candidatus Acidoferrales bacterium]
MSITSKMFRSSAAIVGFLALSHAGWADDHELFIRSGVELPGNVVQLPLHQGTSHGHTVYYLILDTSDGNLAQALGVNESQKLQNARGSSDVQKVKMVNGMIDFPASVDFSAIHIVSAPNGFPPASFQPGAFGEPGYSPLIELPDGTILNAPQIAHDANGDGQITPLAEAADKVVAFDFVNHLVTYRETNGFQGDRPVKYVSTDASDLLAAALEDVTYAPALNAAPFLGNDDTDSSRASLAAFVNGQTGAANPQRQGLNSAVAGDGDPLNVLRWNPSQGRYAPLWDVHLAQWSAAVVAAGQNVRQTDWGTIQGLADHKQITAPGGAPFAASGFIVDCPIVSRN